MANGNGISMESSISNNFYDDVKLSANNDTFLFVSGCGTIIFGGNVMENDDIPESVSAKLLYVISSDKQVVSFGKNGNFTIYTRIGYNGTTSFTYHICDVNDESNFDEATAYIQIKSDFDCDGIFDEQDLDDDNDGIPDSAEGNGLVDTDDDGIPDSFDIDDDNDGIPDVREWQQENNYILPTGVDANHNGWDDVYERMFVNTNFQAVDTDNDGIPDFRDEDSDNDEISDYIEATDSNNDGKADISFTNFDQDYDGLDDAFDIVKMWHQECNSTGSNVPLPDHDNNGVSDFREKLNLAGKSNDEKNKVLTYDTSPIKFTNPTYGLISIQIQDYSSDYDSYIKIFNINGEKIVDTSVTDRVVNIDLSSYHSGIYIVKLTSSHFSFSKKLILRNL